MRRSPAVRFLLLVPLLALPAAVRAQDPAPAPADSIRGGLDSLRVQSVADAERDFARAGRELGVRDAFLAFLDERAVVFTPRATNGPAYYANATTDPVLDWAPALAEAAASDDLGYTTGPFAMLASASGPVVGEGWYFSVWRRNDEGIWQVVLDLGTLSPEPPPPAGDRVEVPSRQPVPPADAGSRRTQLLQFDDLVAAAAQRRGARRALTPALAVDARHNDAGIIVEGGLRIARSLSDEPVSYHRLGDGVSAAGDMAYTYGEYTLGPLASMEAPSGNWLRVWRIGLDGQWTIIQMVTAPIPQ